MNSTNPTLRAFGNIGAMGLSYDNADTMTVDGTINKTGILGAILLLAFGLSWSALSHAETLSMVPFFIAAIGGLILAVVISFKPTTAPYLSPAYAAVEGLVLAAISVPLEARFPHIVLQAALLTFATLFAMLIAYRTGLIKVNDTFRAVIVGATMAVFLYYLVGMGAMFFGAVLPGLALDGSWLSIGIQLVIVVIAAMNLALDFDQISSNAGSAPKYMEWYGGFSLMVTLVWLYITFLRLLANFRARD